MRERWAGGFLIKHILKWKERHPVSHFNPVPLTPQAWSRTKPNPECTSLSKMESLFSLWDVRLWLKLKVKHILQTDYFPFFGVSGVIWAGWYLSWGLRDDELSGLMWLWVCEHLHERRVEILTASLCSYAHRNIRNEWLWRGSRTGHYIIRYITGAY